MKLLLYAVAACMATVGLASTGAQAAATSHKVLVIVEENHTASAVKSGMPYLISLGSKYGHTTNYIAAAHPRCRTIWPSRAGRRSESLPTIRPRRTIAGTSVFAAGGRSYEQSMTSNCQTTASGGYAVKHNPQAYYTSERANCHVNDKPLTSLPHDPSSGLATVSFLTPDLNHDGLYRTAGKAPQHSAASAVDMGTRFGL